MIREHREAIGARASQLREQAIAIGRRLERQRERMRQTQAELRQARAEPSRAEKACRAIQRQTEAAREAERRRIARQLHDRTGQSLTVFLLRLKSLEESVADVPAAQERLSGLQALARQIEQELIEVARDLHPSSLEELGLSATLEGFLDEWSVATGVAAAFQGPVPEETCFSSEVGIGLYRIVQEALANVARHAGARRVSVILHRRSDHDLLIVEDDGCGFDAEAALRDPPPDRRLGLLGMQERVAQLGGTVTIESTPGQGTTVFVHIPNEATDAHSGH